MISKVTIENSRGWPAVKLHPGPAADAAIKAPLYDLCAKYNCIKLKEAIDGFFDGRTRDSIVFIERRDGKSLYSYSNRLDWTHTGEPSDIDYPNMPHGDWQVTVSRIRKPE